MMKKHVRDIPTTEKRDPNEMNVRKSNFKGLQSQAKSLNFVDILMSNDFDVTDEMENDDDEVDNEFDKILLNEEFEDDDYDEAEFLDMSYEEIMDNVELPCHSNTLDADFDIENDEDDYVDDDDDERVDQITHNSKVSSTSLINSITNSKMKNIDSKVKNLAVKNSVVRTKGKIQQSISQTVGVQSSTSSVPSGAGSGDQLPIDNYKDEIIQRVSRDRVTIIHGETGCGKSSRLPVILLEHAEFCNIPCRMMISQPRRIAASSLMKRLRTTLGDKVGMRMGFGIKDETDETVITFVTTGYIVRLLAHHPEVFDDHTHLIIDEVHERSVDGDLLCLLARRLLQSNKNIHLILMSATIHTQLYKTYFSQQNEYYGDLECLSVGVRRFPIDIKFIDDLSIPNAGFSSHITSLAKDICAITKNCPNDDVPTNLARLQYNLVFALVKMLGKLGTGILIFVSGIADITDLTEKFEGLDKFKVIAIHSDIPFEEQETAFLPAESHEVKVIIATNAAESSITLPDVDCVLCLGTHKALQYHSTTHRVHLVNTWISKASATQRAGRTGRVRPGNVYRLYSNKIHAKFLEHEESEIQRTPLQDVILGLRSMLEDTSDFSGVVPVLEDLLEPPDTQNVANSFEVLFSSNMITTANDEGELTPIGRLSANLPVDLQLGRLISYGISLGVGPESIIIASSLSQPKTLFRIASPFIHTDPDELNEIVRTSMLGAMHLDRGMYSEPLMYITLFIEWRDLMKAVVNNADLQPLYNYARKHGLAYTKVKAFYKSTLHLLDRVNEFLGYHHSHHNNKSNSNGNNNSKGFSFNHLRPIGLSKSKQNILRLILIWSSEDNILSAKPLQLKSNAQLYTAQLDTPLSKEHLNSLFPKEVEWKLEGSIRKIYDAKFNRDEPRNSKQLLSTMISFSSSSGCPYVPCVWIISHCKDIATRSTLTIISIAVLASDSILKRSEDDRIEYYSFVTAFSNEFLQKQKSEKKIERAPQPLMIYLNNDEIGKDELGSASNTTSKTGKPGGSGGKSTSLPLPLAKDIYDMYIIKQPSKSELKWWTDAHKFLNKSISLFIPLDDKEHAKLTDNNCFLSTSQLQNLFFGNSVDPAFASNSSSNNEQSGSKTPTKSYHIAEQIISSSQNKIVFPKPNIGTSLKNQSTIDEEDTLINDLPIGMRLLAAYKSMYKDKKLKFWSVPRITASSSSVLAVHASNKDSTKDTNSKNASGTNNKSKLIPSSVVKANMASDKGKTIPSSTESKNSSVITRSHSKSTSSVATSVALVPGSAEWLKNKAKSATQTNNENDNSLKESMFDDENKLTVSIQCISTTWINLTGLGRLSIFAKPPTAMIGRQSPISVAVHCGQGALYAVAYNTMTIGTDARLVFVDGVTVLPPGNRWITLALKCLGKNVSNIDNSKSKSDEDENDDDDDDDDLNNGKETSSSNVKKKLKSKKESANKMSTSNSNSMKEDKLINVDRSVTPAESKRCELICQLLNNISMGPVKLAPEVIQIIRELFSDWISKSEDDEEEECYDNDEVDRYGTMRTQSLTSSSYNNNNSHIKTSTASKNITLDKTSKISNKDHKASKSDSNRMKTILKRESYSTPNIPSNKLSQKSANVEDIQLNMQRLSLSQSNSGSIHSHTVKKKPHSPDSAAATAAESVPESMSEPSEDYDYECDICHRYFMSPIKLYRHISKEHQHIDINSRLLATATNENYKGSSVGVPEPSTVTIPVLTSQKSDTQSFKDKSKIGKQTAGPHQSDSQKSYVCKICHRSFRLVTALSDHTAAVHSHENDLFSLANSTTGVTNLVNGDNVVEQVNGQDEEMDSESESDDDERSDNEDAHTKSMLCALYNSTRGCCHTSCDRLHLHPAINSSEWKSLKSQFKSLKRRSDYADLKPLPLLKFESTPKCSKNNQKSPQARARKSEKRRQRVRTNQKAK